jgi:hypothetical protein
MSMRPKPGTLPTQNFVNDADVNTLSSTVQHRSTTLSTSGMCPRAPIGGSTACASTSLNPQACTAPRSRFLSAGCSTMQRCRAHHTVCLCLSKPPSQCPTESHLIFLSYGVAEIDSSLVGRIDVKGTPPPEDTWLSQWVCLHQKKPNAIAFCPTAIVVMRLKFQSFLQSSYMLEACVWQHREPPWVTCYSMTVVGPPLTEEDGTIDAFVEGLKVKRHSYRMQKTGFGPMTPRGMCHDVLNGEVFEWRWKDDLRPDLLADSMPTVADVRINVTGFVNDLERRVAAPGNTYTAHRVALWTYEALGRQPPAGLMRVADGPAEALARGRYIRDPEDFADELAIIAGPADTLARGRYIRDPEDFADELAIIERDIAATAVNFDDRGNELEDVPELNLDGSIVSRAGFRVF